jgi:hypothetical protein
MEDMEVDTVEEEPNIFYVPKSASRLWKPKTFPTAAFLAEHPTKPSLNGGILA